jgi:GNAT superfamily N-acetyltransferase
MIRPCTDSDVPVIEAIINEAAKKYRDAIPVDCWHEPYMSRVELVSEIAAGVAFSVWDKSGEIAGVMGIQPVFDVTLIRHAYVRPSRQGQGIGTALLNALRRQALTPLLVGTWANATWAIRFYERNGFTLVSNSERDDLLRRYWTVSQRQRDVSVVLAYSGADRHKS